MTVTAWVIGGRGLLGGAVSSAIRARGDWKLLDAPPLPWADDAALPVRAAEAARALLAAAGDGQWAIIWAAGAAVTASTPEQLDAEAEQLTVILRAIGGELGDAGARGAVFYASSAGGIYGGAARPPFTEATAPASISPYGTFKLRAEGLITEFAKAHGLSSALGRIANLYGPGQKLEKMQGLISQIARAQFSTTPAAIYVSLDTVRDYIYVSDCAALVCDFVARVLRTASVEGPTHVTKILATGQGVTIGALLGHFKALSKSNPHVRLGSSPASSLQAHDLRLRSVVWPELDQRQLVPLPAGIHSTMQAILTRLQETSRP
ncbi:hypothetical protein BH09ACT5_BH09ACT5_24410 [soil metagenome]